MDISPELEEKLRNSVEQNNKSVNMFLYGTETRPSRAQFDSNGNGGITAGDPLDFNYDELELILDSELNSLDQ